MRFVSFASSSRGNCTLISYKDTNILVDCGISKKRLVENLSKYDLTLSDIDCILLTHSHSDHISGLSKVLENSNIKVTGLRETLVSVSESLEADGVKINYDNFKILRPVNYLNDGMAIRINDIKFLPLKGCHDVPSLYYKFELGDIKVAILTDMGQYNDNVVESLKDVNYLMLECNYDVNMLLNSNRPEILKSRILGQGGHLSNVECSEIILKIANDNLKEVYLSHISDETNSEDYALTFVNDYIKKYSNRYLPKINIAKRLERTEIII